jgi:hypothetical protein
MMDRAALLSCLAEIVRCYCAEPEAGGLAAYRALRAAGATWSDVLPVAEWRGCTGWRIPVLSNAGWTMHAAVLMCGRLDLATPFRLAEMAVILAAPFSQDATARATELCQQHDAVAEAEYRAQNEARLAGMPRA